MLVITATAICNHCFIMGHHHKKSILSALYPPSPAAPAAAATEAVHGENSKYGFVPPTLETLDAFTADAKNMDAWAKWVEGPGE